MAHSNVSDLAAQKAHPVPLLLVANLPLHPSHIIPYTAQPHAAGYTNAPLRASLRSRLRRQRCYHAGLDSGSQSRRPSGALVLQNPSTHLRLGPVSEPWLARIESRLPVEKQNWRGGTASVYVWGHEIRHRSVVFCNVMCDVLLCG